MSDNDADADRWDYPPGWAPRGVDPPARPTYRPALRSGLGVPLDSDEQRTESDYPKHWRR